MEKDLFSRLEKLDSSRELLHHDYLFELADKTAGILESETAAWRPSSSRSESGGLLDFTAQGVSHLPVIVVPDLHARSFFLFNILKFTLPVDFADDEGEPITVIQALEKGKIRLICVGDLLHSELRCKYRWLFAQNEFENGIFDGPNMVEEMTESLNLLAAVMELKCAFPEYFHVLKGNHENIMNVRRPGNFPFRKFANEGEMVRIFMEQQYGDDVTMVLFCFENALPLAAAFPEAVVSHAEPAKAFSKEQIIEGMRDDEVILGLTWTENDAAEEGSVSQMLKELSKPSDNVQPRYIGGHRPVKENYYLRQNGLYVQIHNPDRQNVALIYKNKSFDPDTDIVSVNCAE